MKKWITSGLGIIAMFAVAWVLYKVLNPNVLDRLRKEWQVEAQATLVYVCNLEKNYFDEHQTFTMDLDELGFMQQQGDGSQFWIELGRGDSVEFIARAYALRDFDLDGAFNVWEIRSDCEPREIEED